MISCSTKPICITPRTPPARTASSGSATRAAAARSRHDRAQPLGQQAHQSATQNEEGERVGSLNRIFSYVYHVRLVGKRMKARNKRVYCAVKYLLIGGILAAFLATAFA